MLLEVENLNGGYGSVPVLNDISFSVNEREIVGMLGHNGAGKTTLLKHLMGYLPVQSGEIIFDEIDITRLPTHRRSLTGLGYVPQEREIFPQLTVEENLRIALTGASSAGSDEDSIRHTLRDFPQLKPLLDRKGEYLSGGEKQLLAIARCLIADPVMVLLDEPTEGIQPSIISDIASTLLRIRDQRGLTILLVEQNFEFLTQLSDRVFVLERGTIVNEADACEITSAKFLSDFAGLGSLCGTHSESSDTRKTAIKSTANSISGEISNSKANLKPVRSNEAPQSISTHSAKDSMTVKRPNQQQMTQMADRLGFSLNESELSDYLGVMEPYIQAYDELQALPDNQPPVQYPRTSGYRPDPNENPLGAWYVKCDIRGAADGGLKGKRIALKDTVSVAGIPMMNGASVLEGYIPNTDATIVTRILDAGGAIAGKATCEFLCLSGGSHTSSTGAVHNPWKRGYMAGGSSSGSGVLVATGEVDMAIGGDQGGSIRIPSSNCGCYGMKPTHGLVPYSGVFPIEQTIDHVGPITSNVNDNALLLEVIAGADGLDPRQYKPVVNQYTRALGTGVSGLRIGILSEGFARPESENDVDVLVRRGANVLKELGALVEELSIDAHLKAPVCWTAVAVEGLQDLMMHGNAAGTNYRGLFQPELAEYFSHWRARADELSASLKVCMFLGEYFQTYYRGKFYGKAQNIARRLRTEYDSAFSRYDLLLMPTLPMKAQPIPDENDKFELHIQRAFEMIGNTCPFNLFGYPAMSIPCGLSEGLPVGMMLVANFYQESTIYRAAHAFENAINWKTVKALKNV